MTDILSPPELFDGLKAQTAALGLKVSGDVRQGLSGELESIRSKWWLGGRKVSYDMSCKLTEADHTAHFREVVVERSWGIPPPTLTVETTTTSGWKRSGSRSDVSLGGGGGKLNYEQVRDAVEKAVTVAGWKFHLEGGRMP